MQKFHAQWPAFALKNAFNRVTNFLGLCRLLIAAGLITSAAQAAVRLLPSPADRQDFSFSIAADMRSFVGPAPTNSTKRYFDGACEALRAIGPGALMLGPGDCDPPKPIRTMLDRYFSPDFLWYPVTGNHETESTNTMKWLRAWARGGIPHLVRQGPTGAEETTYSFDLGNSHFVMLNEYHFGASDTVRNRDDLPDAALNWLEADLAATTQPFIWVVGHKPIRSLPDMDNGLVRHAKESVSTNRVHLGHFLNLLKAHQVRAYICGHTHSTSVAKVNGVWQLDAGHSRGGGDANTPSSFFKVRTLGRHAWVDVYRADRNGVSYALRKTIELRP